MRKTFTWAVAVTAVASLTLPLLALTESALQDLVAQGKQVYLQCSGCHSFERNRTGPRHCGLFGRPAGSVKGFQYSVAMQERDIVWNAQSLNEFIAAPLSFVPGTSMGFVGIVDKQQRLALLTYLEHRASSDQCQ